MGVHSRVVAVACALMVGSTAISLIEAPGAEAAGISEPSWPCSAAPGAMLAAPDNWPAVGEAYQQGAEFKYTPFESAPPPSDFTATVDWGDGATSAAVVQSLSGGCYEVSAPAHSYAAAGVYTMSYTVRDTETSEELQLDPHEVHVWSNVPQLLGGLSSRAIHPAVGVTWSGEVAEFADPAAPSSGFVPEMYAAQIEWESGASPTLGTITAHGNNTFTVSGSADYGRRYGGAVNVSLSYAGRSMGTWATSSVNMETPAPRESATTMPPQARFRFVGHPLLARISRRHRSVEYELIFRLDEALPQTSSGRIQASVRTDGRHGSIRGHIGTGDAECYEAQANGITERDAKPGARYPFTLTVADHPHAEVTGGAVVRKFTSLARTRNAARKELGCG